MSQISIRDNCRICISKVSLVGSLGNHFVNDFPSEYPFIGTKCPLDLVKCGNPDCGLIQLKHTVDSYTLYKGNYWYKSGINQVIVNDLERIANLGVEMSGGAGIWIDIGANDGTLLKFIPGTYRKIGVEPANNLQEELESNCDVVKNDVWENVKLQSKANVITAVGMFYDSEKPNIFMRKVKKFLTPQGIFIAQLMTLEPMIQNNDIGNICHEHLEYYSYKSLKQLFERNGLEIFRVEKNMVNGGSYRILAQHYRTGCVDFEEDEQNMPKFFENINRNKEETVRFIEREISCGKKIYGYGASTKGNTILQYYGLGPELISGIVDINPEKVGKYMLTGIKIMPKASDADYLFILPWGFTKDFVGKERANGYKGKFIVSIPEFKII